MIPYIILLVFVLYLSLFGFKYNRQVILKLISLMLIFFSGFRYNVGIDYPNYVKIFNGDRFYEAKELGFKYIVDILKYIGGTPQLLFFVCAIIIQVLVYKIIKYYSVNYIFSILIFILIPPFFLATFNGVRQFIAITIFIYSLRFLDSNKLKSYFFINILSAFLFHESVLFVMLVFPLINKKLSLSTKGLMVIGVLFISAFLDQLISLTPYGNYLAYEKKIVVSSFTYVLFLCITLLVVFDKFIPEIRFRTVLLNLNLFCFLTLFTVLIQSKDVLIQLFMRLNNYFFFGFIVLIPNLISCIKDRNLKIVSYLFILSFSLYYFFSTVAVGGAHYRLTPFAFNFKLFE